MNQRGASLLSLFLLTTVVYAKLRVNSDIHDELTTSGREINSISDIYPTTKALRRRILHDKNTTMTTNADMAVCPSLSSITGCRTQMNEELPCSACVQLPWKEKYEADPFYRAPPALENKTIYMPVLVPPYFGSSALNGLLDTSPATSSMCTIPLGEKKIPWQCEPSIPLSKHGAFSWGDRWTPEATNWTQVYDLYNSLHMWKNPEAPILLDKAPPNIAKVKGMIEFFESNSMEYRIVVMWRHPCRRPWFHNPASTNIDVSYAKCLQEILTLIPKEKRYFIDYDDLILRPQKVATGLLNWLPQLESLTYGRGETDEETSRRLAGMHLNSLGEYIFSSKCLLRVEERELVKVEELNLWEEYLGEIDRAF